MQRYTNRGEYRTYQMLRQLANEFKDDNFKIYGNLFINSSDKRPNRQVDHLVICRCGIFMLETKYWMGTIYHNIKIEDLLKLVGGSEMNSQATNLLRQLLPSEVLELPKGEHFTMCIKNRLDIQTYTNFENPYRQVQQSGMDLNELIQNENSIKDVHVYIHEFVFYNWQIL